LNRLEGRQAFHSNFHLNRARGRLHTPLRRRVDAKVVYDPAKNGVIVAHDLDTLRLAENSRIHAERLVSCGDFSVLLECVSVEPAYYLCTHAIHSRVHKDARRCLCGTDYRDE